MWSVGGGSERRASLFYNLVRKPGGVNNYSQLQLSSVNAQDVPGSDPLIISDTERDEVARMKEG